MPFSLRATTLFLLALLAPLGTRLIFREGDLHGFAIEAGTLSLYATQLLAMLYVGLVIARTGWSAIVAASRDAMNRVALGLAAVTLIAAVLSANPGQSSVQALWVVLGALVFIAIRIHNPNARLLLSGMAFSGLLQAFLAIQQFLAQRVAGSTLFGISAQNAAQLGASVIETAGERWLRAYGTLPHPNVLGFFLALAIVSTIGLAFITPRKEYRGLTLFLPFLAAGVFFSLSRGAVLSQIGGLSLYTASYFTDKSARHNAGRVVAAISVILVTFASLGMIFREPVTPRITGEGRLEDRSIAERVVSSSDALALFLRNPMLGVGPGQTPYALDQAFPERKPWQQQNAHIVPLLTLAEIGIIGTICYLAFIAMVFVTMFRRKALIDESTSVQAAVLGAWFTVVCAMVFDHFLWSLWPGVLIFWLVAAVAVRGKNPNTEVVATTNGGAK